MFELRKERQSYTQVRLNERKEIERTEIWIDCDALVRDDGFRLVRMGRIPPIKGIRFRCFKGDFQLEFYGDRAHWDGTVTDTWDITLSFGSLVPFRTHSWPPDRRTVEEIAADIESALRAWPPYPEERGIPVGVVQVHITYQCEMRLRFGQHPALRHEPPSTRWRREMVPYQDQQHASLVRDDGVRLIHVPTRRGPENDGADTYHYVDAEVSFDFWAEQSLSTSVTTDTWEVNLNPAQRGFQGFSPALRAELGPTRTAEVIGTIEEALYAWPPRAEHADIPVNRVVFVGEPGQ